MTYSWRILRVDNYQSITNDQGIVFHDVIYALQWELAGTDENSNRAWVSDSLGININLSGDYILRHQITEEVLISWVEKKLGEEKLAEIKNQISNMLDKLIAA